MKKILSIDGGGLHGILAATVLARIEAESGKPVSQLFDMVAGTSIGGIITLGLCKRVPLSANHILELLIDKAAEIFPKRNLTLLPWLWGAKYDHRPLEDILWDEIGFANINSCRPRCLVTSYDIQDRKPVVFRSWEPCPLDLWEIARATSAAPTYFAPFESYIDGGVFANNPSLIAVSEAKRLWPGEKIVLVSLGCGEHTRRIDPDTAKYWGLSGWSRFIISCILDGQSDITNYILNNMDVVTYRIQGALIEGSDDFDDSSPENIDNLRRDAFRMVSDNAYVIQKISGGQWL